MKKLMGMTACLLTISFNTVAQADNATLKIKMVGSDKSNSYFLCVDGVGCVSMFAANQGRTYPLSPGQIERIFMLDRTNMRTYFQPLPASCNVTINANQTLIVKGTVTSDVNTKTRINHLECSVA